MAKINLELVQDKYTNLILYDNSNRCNGEEWINLDEINKIDLILKPTSKYYKDKKDNYLNTIHTYRFNDDKLAYVIPYEEFEPVRCNCYECCKSIVLEIDGIEKTAECTEVISTVEEMVNWLNTQFNTEQIIFYRMGEYIYAKSDDTSFPGSSDRIIKVVGGELLQYIKWNKGIYKGNDFRWHATDLKQTELVFQIDVEQIEFWKEIPEGYFDIQIDVSYDTGAIGLYVDEYTEFTYKQTEIYRAKMFEYIANRFEEFKNVEQRWQTDFELFMQKSIYFDSIYKAYLSSIEIGNKLRAYELLKYLIDFKLLNPIL